MSDERTPMSDDSHDEPILVRVSAKSRTGGPYRRAGRVWRADAWIAVEVPLEIALRLHDDPWLDVKDLDPDAEVEAAPADTRPEAERLLELARARVAELEGRLHEAEAAAVQHAGAMTSLREAHARELSAAKAATTRRR